MRHYEKDSAEAFARVLSLALMADGAPDRAELDCVHHRRMLQQFGLDEMDFETVLQHFCEDLEQSVGYYDAFNQHLPPELIDALLAEIEHPEHRRRLLDSIIHIATADGELSEGEKRLLERASTQWGRHAGQPVRFRHLSAH
mgnify:CR=1 FL=1